MQYVVIKSPGIKPPTCTNTPLHACPVPDVERTLDLRIGHGQDHTIQSSIDTLCPFPKGRTLDYGQ